MKIYNAKKILGLNDCEFRKLVKSGKIRKLGKITYSKSGNRLPYEVDKISVLAYKYPNLYNDIEKTKIAQFMRNMKACCKLTYKVSSINKKEYLVELSDCNRYTSFKVNRGNYISTIKREIAKYEKYYPI